MIKGFFTLILTTLLFLSSLGYVLYTIKQPEFLTAQAREVNFYGRLTNPNNLSPLLEHSDANFGLDATDTTDVIKAAIPGDTFYDFLGKYLTSTLDYLTGKSSDPAFSYDLASIKLAAQDQLAAKYTVVYKNLPVCQPSQVRTWTLSKGLPSCQLPAGSLSESAINSQLRELADTSIGNIPDSITREAASSNMAKQRTTVMKILSVVRLVWLATAVFVLLFMVILRRKSFFSLAGAFLLVGVVEVGFSLIAWDWLGKAIAETIAGGETKALAPLITDFATAVLEVLKTIMGNISIVFLSLGALMIILGFIFRPKVEPMKVVSAK